MMQDNLNFIKYCLGYIKLTRKRTLTAQYKYSLELSDKHFYLNNLLLIEPNQEPQQPGEEVHLETFYTVDPKKLPADKKSQYMREKELAQKIEDLYNNYRNDQFSKQLVFKFGHFEIDLPINHEDEETEGNVEPTKAPQTQTTTHRYPLFEFAVKINKSSQGKYSIQPLDNAIQINVGALETLLGENLYFQLLEEMGKYEQEQKLTLPIDNTAIFKEIWHLIKAKIRLVDNANFSEESFLLEDIKIDLCPRGHYFLVDDLTKLTNLCEENIDQTALTSWTRNDGLNGSSDATTDEKALYFPFRYDKSQLSTLSILGNKASIIQGPPGTGKSETIANLLCHLAATGKRVLFVSQKAQALKVVKDKLKTLDVKYLFGYLPNANSDQLGEEDEADGIASQLSGLESYIEKLGWYNRNKNTQLEEVVETKAKLRTAFNESIATQKEIYQLEKDLETLKEYEQCDISNFECFAKNFSPNNYLKIKDSLTDIANIQEELNQHGYDLVGKNDFNKTFFALDVAGKGYSKIINALEEKIVSNTAQIEALQKETSELSAQVNTYNSSKEKIDFDQIFANLNPEKIICINEIITIKDDLAKTAYDGHIQLVRKFKNLTRKFRLSRSLSNLPRELRDYIDSFISKDVSKIQVAEFMETLTEYFYYFENKRKIKTNENLICSIISSSCKEFESQLAPRLNNWLLQNICSPNITVQQIQMNLSQLISYLIYREKTAALSLAKETLNANLTSCGLSNSTFLWLDQKINTAGPDRFEEIKDNILKLRMIKAELKALTTTNSTNNINNEIISAENKRKKQVALYIQNIIHEYLIYQWHTGGVEIKQTVRKLAIAFGKSKKAFKTFDHLRKNPEIFKHILNLVPVWIMELDDASRITPLEASLFDYVIFDEASQCNIAYALPVMYRSRKVLFVGDNEQMRDATGMFKSNRDFDELAHRYQIPEDRQIKCTGSAVQSVLDMAYKRGFANKTLRCHYRSPAELIGFSNKYFYKPKGKELLAVNSNYLTYKDTNRIMLVHHVQSDFKDEISDNVNVAEANAILRLFKEMRRDLRYKNKSIGILTFLNDQATYIRKLFDANGFDEETHDYKVSIIDGIQGDEKDIIMYSFVIRQPEQKNKYVPLTGENGDIRADINRGRVNVAFSRAKLQVHCFTSLSVQDMPEDIWLKKYLEYAIEHGEVAFCSTALKPFDSYFEETFFGLLATTFKAGFNIQNQVESCGFKIDFVLTNTKTGKRIAIECDGPCHFKDEIDEELGIHIENDEERQRILESAGWQFFRVKYSDWIDKKFNRNALIKALADLLE